MEASPVRGYQLFRWAKRKPDGTASVLPHYYIRHRGKDRSPASHSTLSGSAIPDQKIVRVASTNEKGEIKNRFGYETNSHFKPSGLVISGREQSTQVEYMAGTAFGFLKDKMFLNIAFHAAKVPKLAGGFELSQIVPENLPDPLPIESNFRSGAIFAITYRIR